MTRFHTSSRATVPASAASSPFSFMSIEITASGYARRSSSRVGIETAHRPIFMTAATFESVAGVELCQLGARSLNHLARLVGGAIKRRIVKDHQHTVAASPDVGLEVPISQVDGTLERVHRVLGPQQARASMRHRNRVFVGKCRKL